MTRSQAGEIQTVFTRVNAAIGRSGGGERGFE